MVLFFYLQPFARFRCPPPHWNHIAPLSCQKCITIQCAWTTSEFARCPRVFLAAFCLRSRHSDYVLSACGALHLAHIAIFAGEPQNQVFKETSAFAANGRRCRENPVSICPTRISLSSASAHPIDILSTAKHSENHNTKCTTGQNAHTPHELATKKRAQSPARIMHGRRKIIAKTLYANHQ